MKTSSRAHRIGGRLVFVAALAGCGGGGDDGSAAHRRAATPLACAELAGQGDPGGVDRPADGRRRRDRGVGRGRRRARARAAIPEYCLVTGKISPVDTTAPDILFRVALPTTWNSKVVMFGGGGFDGTHPERRRQRAGRPDRPADAARPRLRDLRQRLRPPGQRARLAGRPASASTTRRVRNFGGDALKKTRDAAVFLIKARYARRMRSRRRISPAARPAGARRSPSIHALARTTGTARSPGIRHGTTPSAMLGGHRVNRALAQPGAYPNTAKRQLLIYRRRLQACDGLDGVVDGLISNQPRCNAIFDPATATLNGVPLRCAGGADTGDTCLSDAQITALKTMNTRREVQLPARQRRGPATRATTSGAPTWASRPTRRRCSRP